MKKFSDFVTEAKTEHPVGFSKVMTPAEMQKHIGKAKFNALTRHKFYKDYFSHMAAMDVPVGMKYEKSEHGFETIHVAHGPVGDEKVRRMAQFQLGYGGRKVDNAHLYINRNGKEISGHPGQIDWTHLRSEHDHDEK